MNPTDYKKTLEKKPSEKSIRQVIEKYRNFKGENNPGPKPNRTERIVINYLRNNEIMPIAGTSNAAGRFVAEYYEELNPTIAEYYSRVSELLKTVHALEKMRERLPRKSGLQSQVKQSALFDEPVVIGYRNPWEM